MVARKTTCPFASKWLATIGFKLKNTFHNYSIFDYIDTYYISNAFHFYINLILRCIGEPCTCVPSNTSSLVSKCAKDKSHDKDIDKIERESLIFNYECLPGDEELDYDTDEDMIGEYCKHKDEDTKFDLSQNIPNRTENHTSTPFGTPPICPDYVGSLPSELEVKVPIFY